MNLKYHSRGSGFLQPSFSALMQAGKNWVSKMDMVVLIVTWHLGDELQEFKVCEMAQQGKVFPTKPEFNPQGTRGERRELIPPNCSQTSTHAVP